MTNQGQIFIDTPKGVLEVSQALSIRFLDLTKERYHQYYFDITFRREGYKVLHNVSFEIGLGDPDASRKVRDILSVFKDRLGFFDVGSNDENTTYFLNKEKVFFVTTPNEHGSDNTFEVCVNFEPDKFTGVLQKLGLVFSNALEAQACYESIKAHLMPQEKTQLEQIVENAQTMAKAFSSGIEKGPETEERPHRDMHVQIESRIFDGFYEGSLGSDFLNESGLVRNTTKLGFKWTCKALEVPTDIIFVHFLLDQGEFKEIEVISLIGMGSRKVFTNYAAVVAHVVHLIKNFDRSFICQDEEVTITDLESVIKRKGV